MPSVTSVNLHRFPDSVLAEVVEESPDGEVSIRSHEFSYVDRERRLLRPCSDVSSSDAMLITECAASDGLTIDIEQGAESGNGTER